MLFVLHVLQSRKWKKNSFNFSFMGEMIHPPLSMQFVISQNWTYMYLSPSDFQEFQVFTTSNLKLKSCAKCWSRKSLIENFRWRQLSFCLIGCYAPDSVRKSHIFWYYCIYVLLNNTATSKDHTVFISNSDNSLDLIDRSNFQIHFFYNFTL